MKLIVISPESEDPREHAVLGRLFAAGLSSYHLRKPTWTREQLAAWFGGVAAELHARIVLHTHHELADEFAIGGTHEREAGRAGPLGPRRSCVADACSISIGAPGGRALPRSRAVHDVKTLRASLDVYDRLLVSPVFPSFSKPGYGPSEKLSEVELRATLALPRRAELIALGGIDASRVAACRDLGFDGVAAFGAIWQAADPLSAFNQLQSALHAHAA